MTPSTQLHKELNPEGVLSNYLTRGVQLFITLRHADHFRLFYLRLQFARGAPAIPIFSGAGPKHSFGRGARILGDLATSTYPQLHVGAGNRKLILNSEQIGVHAHEAVIANGDRIDLKQRNIPV